MAYYTIGVDFGTNSVRAVIIDCVDGSEIGTSVFPYPTGDQGVMLDPNDHNLARQNPDDYIKGLEQSIKHALDEGNNCDAFSPEKVIGIGVDTTGSTPIPVDKSNTPLAMLPEWQNNPAAQAWLWKDHTSFDEAQKITDLARQHRAHYVAKYGGTYSSEWFWSKIWHCLNSAPDVFDAAYSWVELSDYIPALLSGKSDVASIMRGVCAAGHKGMYCEEWGGLPDKEFLNMLDPKLTALRDRLYDKAHDAAVPAGQLCGEWSQRLDLKEGIPIAIGAFDAHYGAIGAGVQGGILVKIIGTSTCDCTVVRSDKKLPDIPGICGSVDGSILPGFYGIEAGQSAVGDIFKWFVETVLKGDESLHKALSDEASSLKPGQSGLLALDWNNGNRTILVNPRLTGLLLGQTLYTTQAEIYRALIEATAFGARAIIDRISEYDVPLNRIICCGGIAEKNPLLMQIYADVTGCVMQISNSHQTCALGSAIAAAVVAGKDNGGYDDFSEAQNNMTSVKPVEYAPDPDSATVYDRLYKIYMTLHDSFGGIVPSVNLSQVMENLIDLKNQTA